MSTPLPNSIAAMAPELTEWRRDLHQHPELGYEETRTSALVAERLRGFGFDRVETGIGGTGVVGALYGAGGAPAEGAEGVMLRADMDALPIHEADRSRPHRSTVDGKMHACGHDGHMTMLLGAAKHLAETRNFEGVVYFCFQPAEEGGAGADAMIRDGLFERFPTSRVFGMHNWPGLSVGQFAVRSGPMLASADEFRIVFQGRGGHAAKPDKARDPLVAAAHFVTAAQTLVARSVDPLEPAVVSITTFHAGSAFNVIPDSAELSGTVRSFNEEVHALIYARMETLADEVAGMFDMTAKMTRPSNLYPPTLNDRDATAFAEGVLTDLAGPENVKTDFPPTMGAEDFSFLSRAVPGCFIFTGNGDSASLHHPNYDFNDAALPFGVAYWTRLVETAQPKT
ncbi:MAG: M20 aminoacylase family protein [Pseudomonadota bacterium]